MEFGHAPTAKGFRIFSLTSPVRGATLGAEKSCEVSFLPQPNETRR